MPITLLIGIGAGLASAILFLSAAKGTPDVVLLFLLSPLPVALAGLGWGWACAATAAAVAAALAGVVGSGRSALMHAVALGAPAAVSSYLLLLSRPVAPTTPDSPEPTLEWYPVGRVVAWAALWSGLIAALALLGISSSADELRSTVLESIDKMNVLRGAGGRALTPAEKQAFAAMFVYVFPWAIASMWLVVATVNLWAAGYVTRLSGRLKRPWVDLSAMTLPWWMAFAFGASVLLAMMPDMTGLIASGFASGIMFAFMLLGLAVLHGITRGMAARPMLLGLVYLSLFFFSPVSTFAVALIGLSEPLLRSRRPPQLGT